MGILKKRPFYVNLFIAIIVAVLGLIWVGEHAIDVRVVTLRYFLFVVSGFVAFVTPYLLFPDSNTPLLQLGNIRDRDLRKYLIQKLFRFHWPLLMLFVVLMFGDLTSPLEQISAKLMNLVFAVTFFIGLNLISLSRYIRSGKDSQFWQESEKGREIRKTFAQNFKYPLDPGSIPSLINTVLITTVGMIAVVIAALLSDTIGDFMIIPLGLILLLTGIAMAVNLRDVQEQCFYTTNAFYKEFFGSDLQGETVVERRKVEQLWWVPSPIRANVWQFLQQIDRKIPAGRAVAVGHLFIWYFAYQRVNEEFIIALWVLFAIAHQLFIVFTLQQQIAPSWLLRWIDSGFNWFLSRVWMQVRWIVPLLLSMNAQQFIFGLPDFRAQSFVITSYLITAILVSAAGSVQLKQDVK